VESPFLELFGRPPRNTSFESERTAAPSVFQAQHLLNSSHIQGKIERSRVLQQLVAGKAGGKAGKSGAGGGRRALEAVEKPANTNWVEDLYIRILSRFPTDAEKQVAAAYMESSKRKPGESICDLTWALMNTKEFVLKH
jgi:hypothetical protein